jgi:hypothetical protein
MNRPFPMISPFIPRTAARSPSTRLAISLANLFRPSSRSWSASSRWRASSNSSKDNVVGPDIKNDRRTGDEARVDDVISEWRYARRVRRFFSRFNLEGALSGEFGDRIGSSVYCCDMFEGEVGFVGAHVVRLSLTGGIRTSSSGWALRS